MLEALLQHAAGDLDATVTVDFDEIFSCVGVRAAHDGKQNLIEALLSGTSNSSEMNCVAEISRGWAVWGNKHSISNRQCAWPGNSNDGDPAFADRCGDCRNSVFHEVHNRNCAAVYQKTGTEQLCG